MGGDDRLSEHHANPRWLRNAFEESFIDGGLTNCSLLRCSVAQEDHYGLGRRVRRRSGNPGKIKGIAEDGLPSGLRASVYLFGAPYRERL